MRSGQPRLCDESEYKLAIIIILRPRYNCNGVFSVLWGHYESQWLRGLSIIEQLERIELHERLLCDLEQRRNLHEERVHWLKQLVYRR